MGQRKRIDLHCMYLPDDVGDSHAIDWGRYEEKPNSKRKKKTSKDTGRHEHRVETVDGGSGVGSLGTGGNASVAVAEHG